MNRTRGLVGIVVAVAVVGAAGWWWGRSLASGDEVAAETAPPAPSQITVPVIQGRVERLVSLRATVRPTRTVDIATGVPDLGFVPAVTAVVGVGDRIDEGDVLYAVAGNPVIVLEGELPMLQDAVLRAEGEDILQLQLAVRRLELDPGGIDGVYGTETAAAVADLLFSRGYAAVPLNGAVEPADPTPSDEQAVTTARLPRWQVVFVRTLPARVEAVTVRRGSPATDGQITLGYGSVRLVGTAPAEQAGDVVEGAVGTASDDQGTQFPVAVASLEPGTDGAVEFQLESAEPITAQPGANLLVRLVAEASGDDALAVPYAALTTRADGSTVVSVVRNGETVVVPVTVGVEGDAAIEVIAVDGGLGPGDRVLVGAR